MTESTHNRIDILVTAVTSIVLVLLTYLYLRFAFLLFCHAEIFSSLFIHCMLIAPIIIYIYFRNKIFKGLFSRLLVKVTENMMIFVLSIISLLYIFLVITTP